MTTGNLTKTFIPKMSKATAIPRSFFFGVSQIRLFSSSRISPNQGIVKKTGSLPFELSSTSSLKPFLSNTIFAQNLLGIRPQLEHDFKNDNLNAISSLPYSIVLPPKDPSVSTFKRLMAIGKEYVKLYKSGISNVWKNNKASKGIFKRLASKNIHQLTQSVLEKQSIDRIVSSIEPADGSAEPATAPSNSVNVQIPSEGNLTRSEYQLLLRTPVDFYKLPLFSVIFAIFFETTPILVLLIPHLVPSTCILPRQQKAEIARNNKNILALKELYKEPANSNSVTKYLSRSVHNLTQEELRAVVKALQIYSSLIPLALISRSSMEKNLKTYIEQIKCDDTLIGWYGGVWNLTSAELVKACQARAIPTEGFSEQELRVNLFTWITNLAEGRYDAGFFLYSLENKPEAFDDLIELSNDF